MSPLLRRDLAVAAVLAVVLALSFCARDAGAHDSAWWIQAGGYQDKHRMSCCGVHDCEPAPWWDFTEDQDGISWRGQRLLHGKPDGVRGGIHWSAEPDPPKGEGQRWWFCAPRHWTLGGEERRILKCIFRPQPGS